MTSSGQFFNKFQHNFKASLFSIKELRVERIKKLKREMQTEEPEEPEVVWYKEWEDPDPPKVRMVEIIIE